MAGPLDKPIYTPQPPHGTDVASWAYRELIVLSQVLTTPPAWKMAVINAPPTRPRDGLLVFADGVNWNPGSGKGLYVYSNGLWVFLQPGGAVNAPAWTFNGNPTAVAAPRSDFTIDGLTLKAVPDPTDELILWDIAGTAIKKATAGSVASTASFTQNGTGAVLRSVDGKLKELYVSVLDFGGSPGAAAATNDAAIVNALSYLASIGGGILFFPRGTYNISATITINSSATFLMGEGRGASTINAVAALNPMINIIGSIERSGLRALGITSTGAVCPSAIQVFDTNETLLEEVFVLGGNTQIGFGIIVSGTGAGYYTRLHKCWVNICSGTAIYITGSAGLGNQLVEISHCNIGCNNVTNYGIFLDRGNCLIDNSGVLQAVLDGIHMTPINGGPVTIEATQVAADTCGKNGWFFSNVGGSTPVAFLTNCWGSSSSGAQPDGNGFFFHGCTNVQMTGCQAWNNSFCGILIDDNSSALRLQISNTEVFGNNQSNNASGHGIYCGTNIPFLNVSGGNICTNTINFLTGHQRYGIFINTGCSGVVTGNLTGGNVTGGINNASGAAVVVGNNN